MNLKKTYDFQKTEGKIYSFWLKTGFFNPDKLPGKRKKKFSIVLPPPNITGELHMGHALCFTLQDILIRWKRLQGFKTLWLPGTDHAGIATQVKVEKEIFKKEGKTKFDLGKEEFLKKIWIWIKEYGEIILNQLKKLGYSLDWSRNRFTLDKEYSKAVETAFLLYFKKGLIYQGERPINWCKRCQTSLSDLELEYKEEKGHLWYIKYPLKIQNANHKIKNYIIVATTRPETMLGDTAVAVNPKDKRYKNFVGKIAILPLVNREIPIISDNLIDPKFGSGAVKVTPAHDLRDYEISKRHKLSMIKVIDEEGKMTKEVPQKYQGLSVEITREKVVEDLKKLGLLEKIDFYSHSVPICYRCSTKIEFLPSKQWFLKMKSLAKKAEKVVKEGKIKFIPRRFAKVYFDWIKNVRDWCVSRQIWWGHKIPIEGEEDVLDTWFSSALWPFATLGWPRKTRDLKNFYPTDVLVTGRDIINLWVARMIFSGLEFVKRIPFRCVFVNPTVLTKEGKRMSKSLGTGIDPMALIEKYGADATRFGLIWQVKTGQDIRFDETIIQMGKKFCNKIWNASRFILMKIQNPECEILYPSRERLTKNDKKILKDLKNTTKLVNRNLEKFEFGKAAETLYHFFWHNFCDFYIETSKNQLKEPKFKEQTLKVLLYVLLKALILLHPFIPFITEEIYQKLPIKNKKPSLMIEDWPK